MRIMLAEDVEMPERAPGGNAFYEAAAARPRYESTWE